MKEYTCVRCKNRDTLPRSVELFCQQEQKHQHILEEQSPQDELEGTKDEYELQTVRAAGIHPFMVTLELEK